MATSSSSGKRRKVLEGELRDTESVIARKRQELEEAKERLSYKERDLRRWSDLIFSLSEKIAAANPDATNERTREDTERSIAIFELKREDAKGAKAEVEARQNDLDKLEEQRNITTQLVCNLGPDAPTYFRTVVRLGAPSDLTSHHAWWKAQKLNKEINPLFLCFVPPEAQPDMPLELVEEVFSHFLVNAKQDVVDQHDCEFTMKLCDLVGHELDSECVMASEFRDMLSKYLGPQLPVKVFSITCPSLTPSLFPTDGCVIILNHMALLAELELDPKTTLFQAMQYYAVHLAEMQEDERQKSFWPCFLIELVGTCIRISGLVYFEKVACQPLTPFLHCYINGFDRSDLNTLCRAMRALRKGVHELQQRNMGSAAVIRNKKIPYHLCSPSLEFQKRIANKLMFVMKVLESGKLKVVKFCRRYNVAVHAAWAEQDLAPTLIHYSQGPDGWYSIEMDYLEPDEWKCLHEWSITSETTLSKVQELYRDVFYALGQAHEISVNGGKTVHGNMRNPNIMVRQRNGAHFDVKFVDFDWSGIEGETLYPSFMNMQLNWHKDVGPGKPMYQMHDMHGLNDEHL